MSLTPLVRVNYVRNTTPVSSTNLNAMQDAIIELQDKSVITDPQTINASKRANVLSSLHAVGFDEQTLTDEQKTQAAANIGITLTDIGKLVRITGGSSTTAEITDFNSLTNTGIWYCSALDGHAPANTTNYVVIVIAATSTIVKQIAMTATTNHLYVRTRDHNSSWSEWKTVF